MRIFAKIRQVYDRLRKAKLVNHAAKDLCAQLNFRFSRAMTLMWTTISSGFTRASRQRQSCSFEAT